MLTLSGFANEAFPTLPALGRMPEIRRLVGQETDFVVHAPRQTGKTVHVVGL